jgi:2-polyprenyl-3-methyl-5-hydroxy-6-metoxy-1,4-benzoquinol methylase
MNARPRQLHWTPELVRRFWDWQSQFPETYFTYLFGAEIAASLMPYLKGRKRVLDYGCGMGFLLPHLAHYAEELTGTDVSDESLRKVNEQYRNLAKFTGAQTVDALVTAERRFDAVVVVEVVEHLYDEQLDAMLASIRRLMAPGAIAIFTTPNEEDLSLNEIYCPESDVVFHRWQHVRSWSGSTLREYLEARGFVDVKTQATNLAAVPPRSIVGRMKWLGKRALGLYAGNPHLLCIASTE